MVSVPPAAFCKAAYPTATLYLGRELTKMYEEMLVGTPGEILDILVKNAVKQKGEFVLILTQN